MSGSPTRLLASWQAAWPKALALWSRLAKLSEPRWCLTPAEERREGLSGSFAMIRLADHAVVVSLRQVLGHGLGDYPLEVLGHEIGHHLYAPGDLADHARCLVKVQAGLPSAEAEAPMISNLYTDLLINDRLQRRAELRMQEIYLALAGTGESLLWSFYLRIYENLWILPRGTLVPRGDGPFDPTFELDAQLGARMVRTYAKDWLAGAGGFAALCLPYLLKDKEQARKSFQTLMDAASGGEGEELPGGLAELDPDEEAGPLHPRLDPRVNGLPEDIEDPAADGDGRTLHGGEQPRARPRPPIDYRRLMQSLGVKLPEEDLIAQYYRELALPHLIPYPERLLPQVADPIPESLDAWDAGSPIEELDWFESVLRSPVVVPGYTTVRRVYGSTEGGSPQRQPVDLYLGVDCSGSMRNPAQALSYPVLAGAILALSALRAGARVKVVLSGEPGRYTATPDFTREERLILRTLTSYLGTGYTFGIPRLAETFGEAPSRHPAQILIVTDSDIFAMLDGNDGRIGTKDGWQVAREALEHAGGGGAMVLHGHFSRFNQKQERLVNDGWDVYNVVSQEDLTSFAASYARRHYQRQEGV